MDTLSLSSSPSKTPLAHAACADKLDALGKEGGIARDTRTALQMLGAGIFILLMVSLFLFGWIKPQDVADWQRPFIPVAVMIGLLGGCACVVLTVRFGFRALHAGGSGTFTVGCPKCKGTSSLSSIHKKKFEFVCPECFALVMGSAEAYDIARECEYCDLRYFSGAEPPKQCPSCGYRKERGTTTCTGCEKPVPKGVIYCRSCLAWLHPEYSQKKLKDFDVTTFSQASCVAYLAEVTKKLDVFASGLEQVLTSSTGPKGLSLNAGAAGQIGFSSAEPEQLLKTCALAVEWLTLPESSAPPMELLTRLETVLASLAESVEKLNATHPKLAAKIAPQTAQEALSQALVSRRIVSTQTQSQS